MTDLASWLRPRWPVFAFLASATLLAAAHAFERIGGLAPCPMCLDQREAHWIVLGVSAAAFVALRFLRDPNAPRMACALIGFAFAWSLFQAGHHVAVEQHWVVATCDTRIDPNDIRPMNFDEAFVVPACDTPAWTMFGISMAGYNAIISLLLMLKSFALALWPERSARHA